MKNQILLYWHLPAAHFRSDARQQVDLSLKVVALPLRHVQMVSTVVHVVLYQPGAWRHLLYSGQLGIGRMTVRALCLHYVTHFVRDSASIEERRIRLNAGAQVAPGMNE